MYCSHCGSQIEDNSVVCPACNAQLSSSFGQAQPKPASAPPVQEPAQDKKKKIPFDPKAKGFAAVASALLAFPAFLCLVLDYVGPPEWIQNLFPNREWAQAGVITWSAYLLGILMCVWMAVVLPAIKPKRPAVAVTVCLAIISLYLLLLSFVNNNAGWYIDYVMPLCLMLTVSSAILSILIAYKVIKKGHIVSAVGIQASLLCVGTEILFDINLHQEINLRWSLILAVAVIGTILVYEAVGYAARINKK